MSQSEISAEVVADPVETAPVVAENATTAVDAITQRYYDVEAVKAAILRLQPVNQAEANALSGAIGNAMDPKDIPHTPEWRAFHSLPTYTGGETPELHDTVTTTVYEGELDVVEVGRTNVVLMLGETRVSVGIRDCTLVSRTA